MPEVANQGDALIDAMLQLHVASSGLVRSSGQPVAFYLLACHWGSTEMDALQVVDQLKKTSESNFF